MRDVLFGTTNHTRTVATDEPGAGGANHHYVTFANIPNNSSQGFCETHFADVSFQNGPVKENGINGCHNEDLICIVIDRLNGFQSGDFACEANERAKMFLIKALDTLRERTNERIERGVEGTNVV